MIFYLIRHGDNESLGKYLPGQKPGIHLNEQGQEQAKQIAASLEKAGIERIYTSPLERTMETAQPLAGLLQLKIIIEAGFIEIDAGDLTGQPFDDLEKMEIWRALRQDPGRNSFPHGEAYLSAQDRLWQAVEHIRAVERGVKSVAIFTHADCIKLIIARAMQMPLARFQALIVAPASLSLLGFRKETTWVGGLNYPLPYHLPITDPRNQQNNTPS